MPVTQDITKVELFHPKGASVSVLLFGATVLSWKSPSLRDKTIVERIFVSSKAVLDGSKPVRGGIPIVFPIFGQPEPSRPEHAKLAQHGFARSELWSFEKILLDNEDGVSVQFGLAPSPAIEDKYPFPFKLTYTVTLAEHQLTCNLSVENPGDSTIFFQALLHTYHRVPAQLVGISPLKGLIYVNKTREGNPREEEERELVNVRHFTDFVYENAGGKYSISWEGCGIEIRAVGLRDVVVWNPQETGKKIADMEDGGWDKFVCVEPGSVADFVELKSGETWKGMQVITAN